MNKKRRRIDRRHEWRNNRRGGKVKRRKTRSQQRTGDQTATPVRDLRA